MVIKLESNNTDLYTVLLDSSLITMFPLRFLF